MKNKEKFNEFEERKTLRKQKEKFKKSVKEAVQFLGFLVLIIWSFFTIYAALFYDSVGWTKTYINYIFYGISGLIILGVFITIFVFIAEPIGLGVKYLLRKRKLKKHIKLVKSQDDNLLF